MGLWGDAREWVGGLWNKRTTMQGEVGAPRIISVPRQVAGVRVDTDSAFKSSVVWACVRVVSESIAMLPFDVYQRTAGDEREKLTSSPVRMLLARQPNPETTAFHFRRTLIAHALTHGNGYAEIVRDGRDQPRELWTLEPDLVTPERSAEGALQYRVWQKNGTSLILPRDRVLHVPGLGFDGVTGYSVISYAAQSIGLALAADVFGGAFFANGGALGYIFKHPGSLKAEAAKRLTESLDAKLTGEKAFKWLVIEEGMEVVTPGAIPKDAQWNETRQQQVAEICRWFHVQPHKVADLTRSTFCLPAGTEVLTEDGPVAVEDIKPGTAVWSRHDADGWVKAPVTKSVCSGVDEILSFNTTNRTIRANARHRILTRRSHPAPRRGQGGYQCTEWRTEYVSAGDLKCGDAIVCFDGLPVGGSRQTPTRQASVGFMEFCGLLAGDGNVYPKHGVTIARATTALYMDHYRDVMRSEFRRYEHGVGGRGDQTVVALLPVHLTESERSTSFASVLAARELQALGLCGNARTKRAPAWVFRLEEDLRLAFLRGFLDADGSVDKKGRASFSSCNRELLSAIRWLCMSCAIPVTNLRLQRGWTTLPNGRRIEYAQWNFTCSDPGANRRIGSHDKRYVERLASGKPFDRKGRAYPRHGGRGFDLPGCSLSRIRAITIEPAEPVYDLEVKGTANFIADGVVVHNSNIEHQAIEFVTDTLNPWIVALEQEVDRKLLGPIQQSRLFCKLNLNALMRGDTAARAAFYTAMLDRGVFSINDVRRLEDMNGIGSDGDKRMVPRNMTTLAMLGVEPTAPVAPEPAPAGDEAPLNLIGLLHGPNGHANGGVH